MPESHWELVLNEVPRDDLDTQPARKKTKFDHDYSTVAPTDVGCSSLHQYSGPHYSVNNESINTDDLADSSMIFDSTWYHAEDFPQLWDDVSPICVNSMAPNETMYYWPSGSAEHQTPALSSQMTDDFVMDFSQSEFGRLDLIGLDEKPINIMDEDEDEDRCKDSNESLADGQVVGAERHDDLVPEICFGMVRRYTDYLCSIRLMTSLLGVYCRFRITSQVVYNDSGGLPRTTHQLVSTT